MPPVVLVAGALADHTAWDGVTPLLSGRAAVSALDRRGRGSNGDRPGSVADEVADVLAVLAGVAGPGDPAVLVGHSSGALLALRAAAADQGSLVSAVVAYEPPPPPVRPGVADALRALLAAGDRPETVVRFLTDAVGVPEAAARAQVADPAEWLDIALAHTLPADADIATAGLPAEVAARVAAPVTLLLGTRSPDTMSAAVTAVAARLPLATVRPLDGQAHFALATAPHLVADAVLDVLAALDAPA